MIHLFLTPSGDLKAFEKMPEEPKYGRFHYDEDDNLKKSLSYEKALGLAKASAVKVKNSYEVKGWLYDLFPEFSEHKADKIYSLEGYKMEIEYPCDCAPECTCKCMVAIISPIEEQKHNCFVRNKIGCHCIDSCEYREAINGLEEQKEPLEYSYYQPVEGGIKGTHISVREPLEDTGSKDEVREMIDKVHDDIEGRYELDSYDKSVIHSLLCRLQK